MISSSHPEGINTQTSFICITPKTMDLNPNTRLGACTLVLYKQSVTFSIKCNVSYLGVNRKID